MIDKLLKRENNNIKLKEIAMNFIIRGLNLFSKFFLTLYIAKFSSPEFLGNYSIFVTTVTISIYLLGLEFYAFSQREYLTNKDGENRFVFYLKNQLYFHAISYIALVPIICFFSSSFIPVGTIAFFAIIMLLEHFNQELYRLLVVIKKPTAANFSYFLRSGIWIFSFIVLNYKNPENIKLSSIFYNWMFGEILCLLFSIYFFKHLDWRGAFKSGIDWAWISKGLRISSIFFFSGIILKLIEYSERYFIQFFLGEKVLGVYFFFYNMAYIPYIFFTSILVVSFLPKIISTYNSKEQHAYRNEMKTFYKATNYFLCVLIPITILFFYSICGLYLTDENYLLNKDVFWGLILASSITMYAEIVYLELYIRHLDKQILYSFLVAEVVCLLSNYFLIKQFHIMGAVVSKIIVAGTLLTMRIIILRKYNEYNKS